MLPTDYEKIEGWCTREKADKLIQLVQESNPKLVVELGVFGGRSLLAFALACKHIAGARVIGIDAWAVDASLEGTNDTSNSDWWGKIDYRNIQTYAANLMIKYQVNDIVQLWKTKSNAVVDKFEDESIDILHQDSNHSEETSTNEVQLYSSKLKKGGFWVFDDTNWSTTQTAQDLLLSKQFIEVYVEPNKSWKIYQKV